MSKYLISIFVFFIGLNVQASSYVSLSPVPTEIIYELGAENNLLAVSTTCNFPVEAKQKPIIGDTHFVNMEMLIGLKPDYLFSMSSAKPMLGELALSKTKPIYFEFEKIEDIYSAIRQISELTNTQHNAQKLIDKIKRKVEESKTDKSKRILYVVQTEPFITIGKNSFITDIIEKSGHKSVTSNLNFHYPNITLEYAIESQPDIILICFPSNVEKLKKVFPNSKFMFLSDEQRDVINRSGPRVYEAVKLFANM